MPPPPSYFSATGNTEKEMLMAKILCGEPSYHGTSEGNYKDFVKNPEEGAGGWFFTRKEIEEDSPSRRDGVSLKKEANLRKSYGGFLQDLGMRLKVPQVTIATSILFCHRFYLRQSHAKNDWRIIGTACMFLAGKVEETPRSLKDVIFVSYQIRHKRDKTAVQRIKHKEIYEQQKELVLLCEICILATLGFDLDAQHPYRPLILALRKFGVEKELVKFAWNFVNDGLRTSISLQYTAPHIAAGAIFLAARFLKVELQFDIEKVLEQEFDITQRQLADMSNQILELYNQNKVPPSQPSEVSSITDCKGNKMNDKQHHERETIPDQAYSGETSAPAKSTNIAAMHESSDTPQISQPSEISSIAACQGDYGNDIQHHEQEQMPCVSNLRETLSQPGLETSAAKDKSNGSNLLKNDVIVTGSSKDAIKKLKLNTEKLRAAFEQRKARGDLTHKMEDSMDELERELEDVEVPTGNKKIKCEIKQSLSRPPDVPEHENYQPLENPNVIGDGLATVEAVEIEPPYDANTDYQSPSPGTRKRKAGSPLDK